MVLPLLLGLVFVAVGLALLVGGRRGRREAARRATTWRPVEGRVVDRPTEWSTSGDDSTLLEYVVVEFAGPDGTPRRVRSRVGYQRAPWSRRDPDERVTVHVDPADPERAEILTGRHGAGRASCVGIAVGGLFVVVGAFVAAGGALVLLLD
ncbi:DUF3592 domain-containing protein [Patulibacter sp. SYSU D01012]|uniref:DUF3592 domain-containing protein n=1 Tax=Patulibacter sp. SYSU D01012 TaxID=2817381 RepID=UPI001B30572C|nr:DUF3592 domain-containing protein [Patulibacter sp. SYSU D01012]